MTCKVMDKHLRALAARVLAAKFLRIDGASRARARACERARGGMDASPPASHAHARSHARRSPAAPAPWDCLLPFARAAQKAAFFVAKLKIKMLPSVMMFKDGVLVARQTGFEGLVRAATEEDFPTSRLLRVLRAAGMTGEAGIDLLGDSDEDEEDGGAAGSGGDMAARMAHARRAMLEAMDDDV